jgi:hypothetical protein
MLAWLSVSARSLRLSMALIVSSFTGINGSSVSGRPG